MQLQAPLIDFAAAPVQTANMNLEASGRGRDRTAIRAAAEQFEAVFLSQILAPMFETVDTDPMFGGGPGEKMYRSLLVDEYGKAIARSGGVGIADQVEREMLKLQETK